VRSFRLLARLRRGDLHSVRFADSCRLNEKAGFVSARAKGSHRIYRHQAAPVLLNLQDANGMAKPNQIRQFLRTMERSALTLGDGK
jgi:predicted RNA binding protein YcfA (HicA-like mRNA interferase family)